jgi:hypothetical protein
MMPMNLYSMTTRIILSLIFFAPFAVRSQMIDSIAFHLYTDSLKKGTHNYINVDGRTDKGRWLPLMSNEISLTSTIGKFEGNDLILPLNETADSVHIIVTLKQNPTIQKEITIWVKKKDDDEILPSNSEYMNKIKKKRN